MVVVAGNRRECGQSVQPPIYRVESSAGGHRGVSRFDRIERLSPHMVIPPSSAASRLPRASGVAVACASAYEECPHEEADDTVGASGLHEIVLDNRKCLAQLFAATVKLSCSQWQSRNSEGPGSQLQRVLTWMQHGLSIRDDQHSQSSGVCGRGTAKGRGSIAIVGIRLEGLHLASYHVAFHDTRRCRAALTSSLRSE